MITTYFKNCIMGNVFHSQTSPSLPSAIYIGLSSTTPTVSGSNVTEPAGGGYQRVPFTNLTAPSGGIVKNGQDIEFPESTADWGTMTHYVLYDAKTGGTLLAYSPLEKPRIVQSESQCRFITGNISISLQDAN